VTGETLPGTAGMPIDGSAEGGAPVTPTQVAAPATETTPVLPADDADVAPSAAGPATPPEADLPDAPPVDGDDATLLSLIDRLTLVLERSDLTELEVTAGETTLILRSAHAFERPGAVAVAATEAVSTSPAGTAHAVPDAARPQAARPAVRAPLTGIYYSAPSPGATPYVAVGDHVSAGQIIGLIEAMKLFNEIKSDLSGKVVRICADNGALVKAKQPLIEVEPQ
jgi:acetyl-CoA carboxylase biotin carboxyl carrier protein